jgi:hypothetical protein
VHSSAGLFLASVQGVFENSRTILSSGSGISPRPIAYCKESRLVVWPTLPSKESFLHSTRQRSAARRRRS